ncbi:MAG: hypothetical protein PVI26_07760, partial [Chitinispirillia bacterium]
GNENQYCTDMKGRMYGMEVLLRHQLGKNFFGWISYTLSKSERKSPNPPAHLYIPDKQWNPEKWFLFEKDQTHNLQLIGSWKLPGNWQPGFRFRYVTGNPYTPISTVTKNQLKNDSEFGLHIEGEGELDIYSSPETQNQEYGDIHSKRMDPFIQLDIRIDKKTIFKNWILSTYIDIQNVNYFWYNSPEYHTYSGDPKFKDTISGMILPKIGLSVEF